MDDVLFKDYYKNWIELYKKDAVRDATYKKYLSALSWIEKLCPTVKLSELTKTEYQKLINEYAKEHERTTVKDFHHLVKASLLDAFDEQLIRSDVTRRVVIKGKTPVDKKPKYLSQYELHDLINDLELKEEITWDWLILLVAKTGIRFSEALGITKGDFDFKKHTLNINKSFDYKDNTGFVPTKSSSSNRIIQLDWSTSMKFSQLLAFCSDDKTVFVEDKPIYNSTVNDCLTRHCKNKNIPEISIHGLRHTHASILLYNGCSVASVSKRLGHSDISVTQKTYAHIIDELDNKDTDIIMRAMATI